MNKDRSFKDTQYAFAAHIRDPEHNPTPDGIEDRRMGVYRELFYNNIEGFISNGFPVLRTLYRDDDWHQMVRSFIAHHESHTPYFLEISQEFLKYLQSEHSIRECDPPFLVELAHYEWVELALSVADDVIDLADIDPNADMLQGHPCISPLAWVLVYRWPVHQISKDFRPEQPPEQLTHIVVYRDRTDHVRFVSINAVTARLLSLLQSNDILTGMDALRQICEEMQHPKPETVIQGGLQALEQLKSQGVVLGTRHTA